MLTLLRVPLFLVHGERFALAFLPPPIDSVVEGKGRPRDASACLFSLQLALGVRE